MVGFLRHLRFAALVLVGVGIVGGVWALDGVLGTGRFIFGLVVGLVLGVGGIFAFIVNAQQKAHRAVRLRQPPMKSDPAGSYDWKVVALDLLPNFGPPVTRLPAADGYTPSALDIPASCAA